MAAQEASAAETTTVVTEATPAMSQANATEANPSAQSLLSALPEGASVAVISMLGSLCPITLGHVQCYVEARKILLDDPTSKVPRPKNLERFDECLGLISLNGDNMVGAKLEEKGQKTISYNTRVELVRLATEDYAWLNHEDWDRPVKVDGFDQPGPWMNCMRFYETAFPKLRFKEIDMNGADDVVKYEKWSAFIPGCRWTGNYKAIVMGRPGATERVVEAMKEHSIDPDGGRLILGPELPDFSSTAARDASTKGDVKTLLSLVHPEVANFLLKRDGHEGLLKKTAAPKASPPKTKSPAGLPKKAPGRTASPAKTASPKGLPKKTPSPKTAPSASLTTPKRG